MPRLLEKGISNVADTSEGELFSTEQIRVTGKTFCNNEKKGTQG